MDWWMMRAVALAADGAWERQSCDIPGDPSDPALESTDVDPCEASCAADPDCAAYVFISGLNRCTLKRVSSPRIRVHLVAATLTEEADGTRSMGPLARDHDHAGKDLEPSPRDLPDAEACAAACLATESCQGMVYIEGYRSCWLKATAATLIPKTVTCALRPAG